MCLVLWRGFHSLCVVGRWPTRTRQFDPSLSTKLLSLFPEEGIIKTESGHLDLRPQDKPVRRKVEIVWTYPLEFDKNYENSTISKLPWGSKEKDALVWAMVFGPEGSTEKHVSSYHLNLIVTQYIALVAIKLTCVYSNSKIKQLLSLSFF